MSTQEAPNVIERLLSSDRLQALADSPHTPVQLIGLGIQDGSAVAAGVIDTIDERIGTRDDERGLPLSHRLLVRAAERAEGIQPGALKEAVEGASIAALIGYGLTRSVMEVTPPFVGKLARTALNSIQG